MCTQTTLTILIIHIAVYGAWLFLELTIYFVDRYRGVPQGYSVFLGAFYMLIKMSFIWGYFVFACHLGEQKVEKIGYLFFLPILYRMLRKLNAQIKKNTVKLESELEYESLLRDIITKFITKEK